MTDVERLEKESISKEKAYNNEYFLRKKIQDELKDYKAENERLEDENYTLKNKIEIRDNLIEQLGSDIDVKYNTIYTMREKLKNSKSEAIKEFAERLKRTSVGLEIGDDKKFKMTIVSTVAIDNLVKEMTEEKSDV